MILLLVLQPLGLEHCSMDLSWERKMSVSWPQIWASPLMILYHLVVRLKNQYGHNPVTNGEMAILEVWSLSRFCVRATSKVISGWVPTCDNAHSRWLYSAASLENQAAGSMTKYSPQSHYPVTKLTSPCPILLMPGIRLGSNKYQFYNSLVWLGQELNSRSPEREAHTLSKSVIVPDRGHDCQRYMSLCFYLQNIQKHN